MDKNNETCVQKVIFRFYYRSSKNLEKKHSKKCIGPEDVRELKEYLEARLERIAQMMEILLKAHDHWSVLYRKDYYQMETVSFDFNQAVTILNKQGFNNTDYSLEVEYTRMWGVL